MSDHLPVLMDIEVTPPLVTSTLKNQLSSNANLFYFQNPSNGRLQIRFEKEILIQKIELLDLSGRLILKKEINAERTVNIDLTSFKRGTYFLRFSPANGIPFTKKYLLF